MDWREFCGFTLRKEEVIRGVSAETLRKFYQKFYHPARMAIIAVGDFDQEQIEQKIKELFDLPPATIDPLPRCSVEEAPKRPRYAVPDSEGVRVASSTDPELSFAQSMVDCKRPRLPVQKGRDVRRRVTEDLFHRALGSRLLRLTLQGPLGGGPRDFFSAGTESSDPLPALCPLSAHLSPLPGRVRPALQAMLRELERVRRFGFHEAEVLRAKRSMLAEFEEDYIEREQRPSDSFAEDLVSHFLDEDSAPGVVERARMAALLLPSVTSQEVSEVAKLYDFTRNVVVKIATPLMSLRSPAYTFWSVLQACRQLRFPRPSLDLPGEEEVAKLMQSVAAEEMEAWPADADDVDARLLGLFENTADKRLPRSGAENGLRAVSAAGVPKPSRKDLAESESGPFGEEVILQNGLRVFLKETDLFDDEILVKGRRWGGLSEFQESGMFSGGTSCEAQVNQMCAMMLGICGLPAESLQECLEGKRVDPSPPSMDAYTTSLDGSSSPADFEVLLMLLSLLFLQPVQPSAGSAGRLSLVKLGLLAWRLAEDRDPASQFRRRVQSAVTGNHPYTWLPSLWRILRLNFQTAAQIFNERASEPREWTFVLAGKLPKKEKLLTLLETYLGCIPNKGTNERPDDLEMRQAVTPLDIKFPEKCVREDVHIRMVEPKGSTVLSFPLRLTAKSSEDQSACQEELRELMQLQLLVRLLETRLVEVLRFRRGQVYSVAVGTDLALSPPQMGQPRRGTISVSFECDPEESDELVAATREELQRLRDGTAALTPENVQAAVEQDRREFEELVHTNSWWAGTTLDLYFSRCYVAHRDIGSSMALWWRVRQEVLQSFDASLGQQLLQRAVPETGTSVCVAMRPKGGKVTPAASED
ncbi:unnamed protein product [Effrenium voratum]|nr:unnamed protein product [Effrenium voratum]